MNWRVQVASGRQARFAPPSPRKAIRHQTSSASKKERPGPGFVRCAATPVTGTGLRPCPNSVQRGRTLGGPGATSSSRPDRFLPPGERRTARLAPCPKPARPVCRRNGRVFHALAINRRFWEPKITGCALRLHSLGRRTQAARAFITPRSDVRAAPFRQATGGFADASGGRNGERPGPSRITSGFPTTGLKD